MRNPSGKKVEDPVQVRDVVKVDLFARHRKNKKKTTRVNKVDAFRFMMDSRKKVIGSNSPGKNAVHIQDNDDSVEKSVKSKRKLFLEKWSDEKGGKLRKERDEIVEQQIERKLDTRKRNFTRMLQNKTVKNKSQIEDKHDVEEPPGKPEDLKKSKSVKPPAITLVSSDDDDFLSKLSPSLKKKDMLGYFQKVEKKDTSISKKNIKKTSKKSKILHDKTNMNKTNMSADSEDVPFSKLVDLAQTKLKETVENTIKLNDVSSTNSKRNRKCVKYVDSSSSDSEISIVENNFTKLKKKLSTSSVIESKTNNLSLNRDGINEKIVSPIKIINIKSPINIKCVRSPKSNTKRKSKEPPEKKVKLAPLFLKNNVNVNLQKTPMTEAKQSFLYSNTPKIVENCIENAPYVVPLRVLIPEITHVQQIPKTNDDHYYIWNLSVPEINYSIQLNDYTFSLQNNPFLHDKLNISKETDEYLDVSSKFLKFDTFKEGLNTIKSHYPNFPVYKCFRQLREKFDMNQTEDDVDVQRNKLWVDKYKAIKSEEIIGNFSSVASLKKWLTSWKDCKELLNRNDSDSSDDFYSSDSNDSVFSKLPNNLMIISGPHGSGKTHSVYAIANELEMNVLEIHASSKRTGKKVLLDLQEATQSHKVVTNKSSDIFNRTKKDKQNGKRKSKELKRKIVKKIKKETSTQNGTDKSKKMSLILIEDADIVFDEDEGFMVAVSQIVQSSKRPVVLITSDPKCAHLKKFMNFNNVLHFQPLSGKIVGPWLDILILLESKMFLSSFSKYLIDLNSGDMRKTINQIQFWICNSNTCEDNKSNENTIINFLENNIIIQNEDSNASWTGTDVDIKSKCTDKLKPNNDFSSAIEKVNYFDSDDDWKIKKIFTKLGVHLESFKNIDGKNNFDDIITTLEDLSTFDALNKKHKNDFPRYGHSITDSISELENDEDYDNNIFLSEWSGNVLHHLEKKIDELRLTCDTISHQQTHNKWISKHRATHSEMFQVIPVGARLTSSSFVLDYMPNLRSICRTEKMRSTNNEKRNKRFYHYLDSLNIDLNENTYDNACDVFNSF